MDLNTCPKRAPFGESHTEDLHHHAQSAIMAFDEAASAALPVETTFRKEKWP